MAPALVWLQWNGYTYLQYVSIPGHHRWLWAIDFILLTPKCPQWSSFKGTVKNSWNYYSGVPQDATIYYTEFMVLILKWSQVDCWGNWPAALLNRLHNGRQLFHNSRQLLVCQMHMCLIASSVKIINKRNTYLAMYRFKSTRIVSCWDLYALSWFVICQYSSC